MVGRFSLGVFALGLVFLGALFLVIGVVNIRGHTRARRLADEGLTATAKPTKIECNARNNTCTGTVTVTVPDGRTFQITQAVSRRWQTGGTYKVLFDPDHPKAFYVLREARQSSGVYVFTGLGGLLVLVGIALLVWRLGAARRRAG